MFAAADGTKLPYLSDADWARVVGACYFAQLDKCRKSAAECMAANGKCHDKLPAKLMKYLLPPGHRARSSSRPPPAATANKDGPKTRWDTNYCWKHADGTCTDPNCPRKEFHMTEAQAKAKAKGIALAPKAKGKAKAKPKPAAAAALSKSSPVKGVEAAVQVLGAVGMLHGQGLGF